MCIRDSDHPVFFLYMLQTGDHRQVGVVGLVETADYKSGRIKRHERVKTERADHLSRHIEVLGVQSSPIAFGYRADPAVRMILDDFLDTSDPVVSFTSGDGLEQALWVMDDPNDCAALSRAFESHDLYIMDGHHRAAAASALHDRVASPRGSRMLGVLFSDDRVNIDPFHRRVTIAADADLDAVVAELTDKLQLRPSTEYIDSLPEVPGHIGVYAGRQWWSGVLPDPDSDSPLDATDPVRLQRRVIGPLLGIDPEGADGAISYFLDTVDRGRLAESLSDREILFVLREVSPTEVFAVADAGLDMPPKSTYVTPKPRSGVFLRRF